MKDEIAGDVQLVNLTQVAVGGLRKAALVPVAALSRRAQHTPAPPAPAPTPVSGAATIS